MTNWICPKCGRIFMKKGQIHSCKKYPIENHFNNKETAKGLFTNLVKIIEKEIGPVKIISLPCCIHFFSNYDFGGIYALQDKIKLFFGLERNPKSNRIIHTKPVSKTRNMYLMEIAEKKEIDKEVINWLKESYKLKDK